jgi:pSer/pThr/pTyr-binding forkhead associated (FHA) protein
MARTVLTITSDLFDEPNQEASIRENLPIRTLIAECRSEFDLPDGNYTLRVKSTGKLLDPDKTLEQSGVQTGAVLILTRERRVVPRDQSLVGDFSRRIIAGPNRAFLAEEQTGKVFEIQWQPAIIGRPDANNPASADQLAVNLGQFDAAKTVSRHHARITEQAGQYFLESLADHNPTYLNDGMVRVGERRLLQPDDKIRVGKFVLTFGIRQG